VRSPLSSRSRRCALGGSLRDEPAWWCKGVSFALPQVGAPPPRFGPRSSSAFQQKTSIAHWSRSFRIRPAHANHGVRQLARPAGVEPATLGLEGCGPVSEAACVSTGCDDCHADVPRVWSASRSSDANPRALPLPARIALTVDCVRTVPVEGLRSANASRLRRSKPQVFEAFAEPGSIPVRLTIFSSALSDGAK